ncbi:hypothetical protein [Lentzea aerocolonigenes]|uniref:hypothetical protein n=1 Tax=Lentzea aerocolonigenes TaxID=68170 RepID=UPI0004C31D2A|nr:hypothetical protein [Lentzea aerocolonigenes]
MIAAPAERTTSSDPVRWACANWFRASRLVDAGRSPRPLAVGGDWPGSPGAGAQLPQDVVLDHVRMYR